MAQHDVPPPGTGLRRTLLATERTYLAWWRTGLTTLTVALAAARIVPELADSDTRWPYTAIGAGFALVGMACVVYAELRRRAVIRAIQHDDFAEMSDAVGLALSAAGVVLGVGLLLVILLSP